MVVIPYTMLNMFVFIFCKTRTYRTMNFSFKVHNHDVGDYIIEITIFILFCNNMG